MTGSNPGGRRRTPSSAAGQGSALGAGRAVRGPPVTLRDWPAAPPGRVAWESARGRSGAGFYKALSLSGTDQDPVKTGGCRLGGRSRESLAGCFFLLE